MADGQARRRRGAALEEALLDAAWIELSSHGYTNFTVEGVVKRAGTSRPVIYRRWPTRASLAAAALTHFEVSYTIVVPDLGGVRAELCLFLRKYVDRMPRRLMRLVLEMMSEGPAEELASAAKERAGQGAIRDIITRGIARGEIDAGKLSPRILRLPVSLVASEIAVSVDPVTDAAIAEIVDEIFLPLARAG